MKLLIVDDEELTRSGLVSSIAWTDLGITEVFQAADGLQGLAAAGEHRPEIILCDIRMPRMDGIQMAKELQQILPDTAIIFMSGYSDKEYLMAAIRLKAVRYVEKPLNPREVCDAVTEAAVNCRERQRAQHRESHLRAEHAARLGLMLTFPYKKHKPVIDQLWDGLNLPPMAQTAFITYLVKFASPDLLADHLVSEWSGQIRGFLKSYQLFALITNRYQNYLVIHVGGTRKVTAQDSLEIAQYLKQLFNPYRDFYLTCGQRAESVATVSLSYETSVLLMESCFFFAPGSMLTPDKVAAGPQLSGRSPRISVPDDLLQNFFESVRMKDQKQAEYFLTEIYQFYYQNTHALSDQAKEVYYKLFTGLEECRSSLKILLSPESGAAKQTTMRYLEEFFSLDSLHQALTERTRLLFYDMEHQTEEHPTILLIKNHIRNHYMDESLSVKDISEHVHLNTSYLCTVFKAETGQTLNQYLTEYRMERAKKLLRDPRYKITEIAPLCGYSDSNYFGKSFKKTVGISPTEYREKWMI